MLDVMQIMERIPHFVIFARKDSPLVIGNSGKSYYLASDIPAFLSKTNKVIYLEDNEYGTIK